MPARAIATIIYALLALEAINAGLWVTRLLPTLAVREWTSLALILMRAAVSSLQLFAAVQLRTGRLAGPALARAALAASALLMPFEVGWRLVPTSADPTYRWWIVLGYGVYAALAIACLRIRPGAKPPERPPAGLGGQILN